MSYGRLVAILTARTGNLQDADDALSDALVKALRALAETGAPDHPEAWLLTTARLKWTDAQRSGPVARRRSAHVALLDEERSAMADATLPDDRLKLMFACAHPSIEAGLRAPLILQAVLDLTRGACPRLSSSPPARWASG